MQKQELGNMAADMTRKACSLLGNVKSITLQELLTVCCNFKGMSQQASKAAAGCVNQRAQQLSGNAASQVLSSVGGTTSCTSAFACQQHICHFVPGNCISNRAMRML